MGDNNKQTGSYYTPLDAVVFMNDYILDQGIELGVVSVLEPCAGDGRFLRVLLSLSDNVSCVEVDEQKAAELGEKFSNLSGSIYHTDFLEFAMSSEQKYDLIIGNPPYISKKNISRSFLEKAKEICRTYEFSDSLVQNSWVAFILASMALLKDRGVIFFVLPFEFLQVQYAEKLRASLENRFNIIHIIAFRERMFPEIEQETCLVYLANKEEGLPYISYRQYDTLKSRSPQFESRIERNKPLKKWSNAVLSDTQIELLKKPGIDVVEVGMMGESSPGIVTAANNYFILTADEVERFQCAQYVVPIIAKSAMLKHTIALNSALIEALSAEMQKVFLLNLKESLLDDLPTPLIEYLESVGNIERNGRKLKDGYKCSRRNPWYGVPLIKSGEVCFFKRYDKMPRMCLNESSTYTTDIAYGVRLKKDYDPKSVVFCFYNSLTLAQCEFVGRFYAGGVSELTPSEFKSLKIPYKKISESDFDKLNSLFSKGANDSEIVQMVDSVIFDKTCFSGEGKLNELSDIRQCLMDRRTR